MTPFVRVTRKVVLALLLFGHAAHTALLWCERADVAQSMIPQNGQIIFDPAISFWLLVVTSICSVYELLRFARDVVQHRRLRRADGARNVDVQ